MPHADHFLSRLDRLASTEVELALQLYRDPALLRAVLAAVALPQAAERVALALGDASVGPYLVVTRDGHFVTCLAKGMGVGELPVVTRGQLDALSGRFETLRERLALATQLTGARTGERACSMLMRRILRAADTVGREDFLAVSPWQPLLAPALLGTYLSMSRELVQQSHVLRNLRVPKKRRERALHEHWNLLHAAGHLALLATMDGEGAGLAEIAGEDPTSRSAFCYALTSSTATRFIAQGAWAAGRLGKLLLPAYKRALAEDVAFFDWLDTVFALVAIARRKSGLRAEVRKALGAVPGMRSQSAAATRLRQALPEAFEAVGAVAAEVLERDESHHHTVLARMGAQLLDADPGELSELPADVLCALPFASYADGLTSGKRVLAALSLIGASARRAPELLYLPREFHQAWRPRWEPALTETLLGRLDEVDRTTHPPATRAARPRPNEPCGCGSGRKYKKCCGSPAGAAPPE